MTGKKPKLGVIVGCLTVLGVGPVMAADWPQWRGPNRDGKVSDFTPPKAWPKELQRKWKATIGAGHATPALVADRLYVFARRGDEETAQCLEADTGKVVWQDKYATTVNTQGGARDHPGPRSSPAVADGKVVTLDEGATVSCLNAADGKVLWRKDFNKEMGLSWPGFNTSMSPVVVDGVAVAHLGGRGGGSVLGLDLNTGAVKWKWDGEAPAYASPAVMTVDGVKQVVLLTGRSAVGLSPDNGKLLWQTPFGGGGGGDRAAAGRAVAASAPAAGAAARREVPPGESGAGGVTPGAPGAPGAPGGPGGAGAGPGGPGGRGGRGGRGGGMGGGGGRYNAASPVIDGQTVILTGSGTKSFKIEKQGETFAAKELWSNAEMTTVFNTPVLKDDRLYGLSGGGSLFCLDAKTGKTLWSDPNRLGQRGFGTIVDAGAVMLALTPSAELIVFKPGEKYEEVARLKVADTPTYSYPVLAGNRLFVKDRDSVMMYAIE